MMRSRFALRGGSPARAKPIEATVFVSKEARAEIDALLERGTLSDYYGGSASRAFEDAFASLYGPGFHAVAVNSGTSALHLALSAADVRAGDEVIVPAFCFVAAVTAVVQNGAIPVICDAEPGTLTMDVDLVRALIGPRTKAIVAVHFWGYPSNTAALAALADERGFVLVEDCAQALGASIAGLKVGSFGRLATFAFSVRKHVACGEGGLVLCQTEGDATRLRSLANYGKGPGWDDYISPGFSYRMAEIPAVIARDSLSRLDDEVAARQRAGRLYRELFQETTLTVVDEPAWGSSVYFKCPVLLPSDLGPLRREMVRAIAAENVSCRVPHRPLYTIPWLVDYLSARGMRPDASDYPVATRTHARLIEIETGPHLGLEEARVSADVVLQVWREVGEHLT